MKVLLVVNSDQNETEVTRFAAVQMKKLLESRGFFVAIHEIPKEESWIQKVVDSATSGKKLTEKKIEKFRAGIIKKISIQYIDFHIFDLHTTPDNFLITGDKKPGSLKVRQEPSIGKNKGNVPFDPAIYHHYDTFSRSYYFIELPAKYKPISGALLYVGMRYSHDIFRYFEREVDLKATKAANLVCPRVLAKAVHMIDSIVKTKEGAYNQPRYPKYWPKKPRRRFRGPEFRKKLK